MKYHTTVSHIPCLLWSYSPALKNPTFPLSHDV